MEAQRIQILDFTAENDDPKTGACHVIQIVRPELKIEDVEVKVDIYVKYNT